MRHYNKMIGGILLVSGTTIGAAMLALPVSTGLAGFVPSLLLIIISWLLMTYTAFLILEVNLWMNGETNLVTMARRTLGKWGAGISWVTYLFLLYALTTAYIAGSAPITVNAIKALTGTSLPNYVGSMPLLLLLGFFIYRGTESVDKVNRLLMIGLAISYVAMVLFLTPYVDLNLWEYSHWNALLIGVSVVATSFGFHIIIPSLSTYLQHDVKALKKTIWIGSLIPVIIYIIWEAIALGILPLEGEKGIYSGYLRGNNGADLLGAFLANPALSLMAHFFSFFAVITSFLGVALSLSDFLADGLNIKKTRRGRILLCLLTFIPPLIFTLTDPRAFLSALEYAGAFGVVVLLGLLPAFMVWRGRYYLGFESIFTVPGGKGALVIVVVLSLFVISLEIANKLNWIHVN